ncbi:MAG: trigger factor [Parcubacteria group bacterium Athens0714_16]|nr:MAG: trigger factor [Parcubacteria group bacterium Athens0714_16]
MANEKYNIKTKDLEKSQMEIEVEIPWKEVDKYRKPVISEFSEKITVPGFRKGRVPEDIIVKKIGHVELLNEMVERAIQEIYPEIILNGNINAIGRPSISITKLAENNALCFKAITSVVPKIELPDYKEKAKKVMAKKEEEPVVTDKEFDEAILGIRKQWALYDSFEKDHAGGSHEHKKGEKTKSSEAGSPDVSKETFREDLPEFNDEFVKKLGKFENVEDFSKKLRENILYEKQLKNKDKKRGEIIEGILKETKAEIPEILTESELEKMLSQLKTDVENARIDFKTYLIKLGKTEEELRKEWKPQAEKKAKTQLILNEVALKENLFPDKEELQKETDHLLEHYKSADPERVRIYVETVLANEKVMTFLENAK